MTASSPVSIILPASCAARWRAPAAAPALVLWAARTDGSSTAIEAGLSAPSREAAHLVRLLKDKIETLDMGFGVDLMALAALATERLSLTQTT